MRWVVGDGCWQQADKLFGQQAQVAAALRKNAGKLDIDRIAQTFKNLHVVLKRRRLLGQLLVQGRRDAPTPFAMLVDVLHPIASHIETHAQKL